MKTFVMCRQASDYLKPGCVTGYQCHVCQRELQVTPQGVENIGRGAIPLCNPCTMEFFGASGASMLVDGPQEAAKFVARFDAWLESRVARHGRS